MGERPDRAPTPLRGVWRRLWARRRSIRVPSLAATPAQREFERLGPWLSRFVIDGQAMGGQYNYRGDPRLDHLIQRMGSLAGRRVLELGALEGGHTLELARAGASVVAIEGHAGNYERCRFVKQYFRLDAVEFVQADLRAVEFARLGRFDAVLNSGVLYHLDAPWAVLAGLARVAPRMLVWTHCAPLEASLETVMVEGQALQGYWYEEPQFGDHGLSGRQPRSFWPTREGLAQMLRLTGWPTITWLSYEPTWERGPAATLWVEGPGAA